MASSPRNRIAVYSTLIVAVLAAAWFFSRENPGDGESSAVLLCATDEEAGVSPLFNHTLTDVALLAMDSRPVMLHELAGEELTTVIFCSYRCPCSDGYADRLRTLQDMYSPRGVSFLGIHSNTDETVDGMKSYIRRKNYPLPVYRDGETTAADLFEATVTPEVFVFDSMWRLVYHGQIDDDKSGLFVEEHTLQNALDTLLTGGELINREKLSLGCAIVRADGQSL